LRSFHDISPAFRGFAVTAGFEQVGSHSFGNRRGLPVGVDQRRLDLAASISKFLASA
jgi:hypothetical protein